MEISTAALQNISGESIGKPCTTSNQCQSQNCIQVCNANSKQVCGASKWKHPSKNYNALVCFNTLLKPMQYVKNDKVANRFFMPQKQKPARFYERKANSNNVSGLSIGMTCTTSNQCKSQSCINVCNSNSNAKVCGYNAKEISNVECFDTLLKRTKYGNNEVSLYDALEDEPISLNSDSLTTQQNPDQLTSKFDTPVVTENYQVPLRRKKPLKTSKIKNPEKVKKDPSDETFLTRVLSYYSTPHRFVGRYANNIAHNILKRKVPS